MAKILQFPDRIYQALHNAAARSIISLQGTLKLLSEELGPPAGKSAHIIAWVSASNQNGELVTADAIPLMACTDPDGNMLVSRDEVFEDFADFIRQLPHEFRMRILDALAESVKSPLDAPEGSE